MVNYLLFPVTRILRSSDPTTLPDEFLEAAFGVLAMVVRVWRDMPSGIDVQAWEQLWRFVVAAVGPKLVAKDQSNRKGKERAIGQEVQFEAVRLLTALLEAKEDGSYPTEAMRSMWSTPRSPLMPTLFQSITVSLSTCSPYPAHLPLQKASLTLLRHLISFLKGQHAVLASVLPGVISGISKLFATEGKSIKGEVSRLAAEVANEALVCTLNDEDLRSLGVLRPRVDDLTQLADEWKASQEPLPPDDPTPPSPTPSTLSSSSKVDPFPPLSASYLAFTSTQLLSAIPPILSLLASNTADTARQAAADLAESLISHCSDALPLLVPHALRSLLLLSQDTFDPVRHNARRKLRILLSSNDGLDVALIDLLSNSINALPRLILSQQDVKVDEIARLVTALAETNGSSARNPIADLLGSNGKVERWSWSLLNCLEFGRPAGWSAAPSATKTAELGWGTGLASGILPILESGESESSEEAERAFPHLPLRHVESVATARALGHMLESLGAAGGDATLHSVDYFLQFAKTHRNRDVALAVSAMWVAERLLEGLRSAEARVGGRGGKATRKMAREAARLVVTMDEEEDEDDFGNEPSRVPDSDELVPIERGKGLMELTTLLDRPTASNPSASAATRRLHLHAQRILLSCNSLSLLSLTSRILSSSFRPLLLHALYAVLSHLASSSALVREYAGVVLTQIAYHTGYASARNLILDNVDYVINVVSLRLTRARLSSQAPLVLIAMIRLVGADIVPMVHDVVDEIFDALDDYHGYEALASGLLAVLVTLIETMEAEVKAEGVSEARLEKMRELRRIEEAPDPKRDFKRFEGWWNERKGWREREREEILERAPRQAWEKDEEPQDPPGEEEAPPTRTQEVATQILEKSLHFLTHSSPFLRARILDLIASAVPVLAAGNRESDLLPLVDRAWGSIMHRLDDPSPYVVTAAAQVIASLSEHVGDFMSKRILDHAWPRFQKMLSAQKAADGNSALARKRAVGTQSSFTTSHRLHVAMLRAVRWVVEEVPVNEDVLWGMSLAFRSFLDKKAHPELQALGKMLYGKLAQRDGEAVWVVLRGTMGAEVGEVWGWLRDPGLDVEGNADEILAAI
jgi:hypothetical protein